MIAKPDYRIEADPKRSFLRVTLSGHMDDAILTAFGAEMEAVLARMKAAGGVAGSYLVLVDTRDHGVQSQEVMAGFQAISANHTPMARKVAVIMSSSVLHKMQVRRSATEASHALFVDEEEALRWLFADDPPTS